MSDWLALATAAVVDDVLVAAATAFLGLTTSELEVAAAVSFLGLLASTVAIVELDMRLVVIFELRTSFAATVFASAVVDATVLASTAAELVFDFFPFEHFPLP